MATTSTKDLVRIEDRIRSVRGVQVIFDADLAEVYGVSTRALNQAIRRNRARFPVDFAFLLTPEEWGALRSQFVISKPGRGGRRHSAWVFTEHGAIMAASVLSTTQAVEMSVFVVRAFVKLKDVSHGHAVLAANLAALERRVIGHDADLKAVFAALRAIVEPSKKRGRPIGFQGQ